MRVAAQRVRNLSPTNASKGDRVPIYEYDCKKCERPFETLVLSPSEVISCPGCGSPRVEKRFSVFGVGASSSKASEFGGGSCGMPEPGACPPTGCSMPNCSAFD